MLTLQVLCARIEIRLREQPLPGQFLRALLAHFGQREQFPLALQCLATSQQALFGEGLLGLDLAKITAEARKRYNVT